MELIILPSYSYAELHATVNTRHCPVGAILLPWRLTLDNSKNRTNSYLRVSVKINSMEHKKKLIENMFSAL